MRVAYEFGRAGFGQIIFARILVFEAHYQAEVGPAQILYTLCIEFGKCQIKLFKVPQIRDGKSFAKIIAQMPRKPFDYRLAVIRAFFPALLLLHDAPADFPIRVDHRAVDGGFDAGASFAQDG
jgi:hypothetical protein